MIGHIKSGQYLKNIARAILKKYCPPHKARGIHDFILATKSSVWIIILNSAVKVSVVNDKNCLMLLKTNNKCFSFVCTITRCTVPFHGAIKQRWHMRSMVYLFLSCDPVSPNQMARIYISVI